MPVPTILADAYFANVQTDRVTRLVTFRDDSTLQQRNVTVTQEDFKKIYAAVTGGKL